MPFDFLLLAVPLCAESFIVFVFRGGSGAGFNCYFGGSGHVGCRFGRSETRCLIFCGLAMSSHVECS